MPYSYKMMFHDVGYFLLNVIQVYAMQIYPIYFYLLYNPETGRFSFVN
jgi:hypothetical protein